MHSMGPTHEVLNQPPPLVDYDAAAIDVPLTDGLARLDPERISASSAGWPAPPRSSAGPRRRTR